MNNILFLTFSGLILMNLLAWGFKYLPGERWQMLAVVPIKKREGNNWQGTNLTYYGFFIATSQLLSISLLFILLGAMHISLPGTFMATGLILAICLPAARIVARIVEKKHHTFTIGGASFVGIIFAPFAIFGTEQFLNLHTECYLPLMPVMAAMSIAYTLGEGLGRLGCLSYGCCYGKPLSECRPFMQKLFRRTGHIFYGEIKKASYEASLNGKRLVPIQAITCVLYTATALAGSWLFLEGKFTTALLFCISVSQLWRIYSETMRADFRGFSRISVYQKLGVLAVLYTIGLACIRFPPITRTPVIVDGISALWNPAIIIGFQLTWLLFFLYFGRSTVTSATVSFSLIRERI